MEYFVFTHTSLFTVTIVQCESSPLLSYPKASNVDSATLIYCRHTYLDEHAPLCLVGDQSSGFPIVQCQLSTQLHHCDGYLDTWILGVASKQLRLLHGRVGDFVSLVNFLSPQMSKLVEDAVAS